jgi:RNA-directed DNA polymerase
MERVGRKIADGRVLRLIEDYLKAGVMESVKGWQPTERGTPQGAVISPLLANIYLDPLDWEMAQGNQEMVRYADDCAPRARGRAGRFACSRATAQPMRERRPLETCLQEPVSNHLRPLWSKAMVVSTRRKRPGKNRVR